MQGSQGPHSDQRLQTQFTAGGSGSSTPLKYTYQVMQLFVWYQIPWEVNKNILAVVKMRYTYIPSPRSASVRHRPKKPSWRATSVLMTNLWRDNWCCVSVPTYSCKLPLCQLLSNCKWTMFLTSKSIAWISVAAMLIQCLETPKPEFTVFVWIITSHSSS